MRRFLMQMVHQLGTGRAVENARREHDETARTLANITALESRLAALHAAPAASPRTIVARPAA
jgi:hypothetical protein